MSRRLLMLAALTAFVTAACSELPNPATDYGTGIEFVPMVADALDNVGLGVAISVDADGLPYLSYLGFKAELKPGELQVTRPIQSPMIPAVQLTHLTSDGVWNRGAVAESADQPAGITVPFGGSTIDSMADMTADNSNGTAIALDASGGIHVAWTGQDGVWYANTTTTTTSATATTTTEQVYKSPVDISTAGPISRPSITVDADGNPWISFATFVEGGKEEIRVLHLKDDGWTTDVVATVKPCNGCGEPGPAPIAVVGGNPAVAYASLDGTTISFVQSDGKKWAALGELSGQALSGLSMVGGRTNGYLAYYEDGSVKLATVGGGGGTPAEVAKADLGSAADATGNEAPTTGVAMDKQGTLYVGWQDTEGVHMASGDGSTFSPVQAIGTDGGVTPTVGVAADASSIYLAWYDPSNQNLMVGVQGDTKDLLVAQPSPSIVVSQGPPPTACGEDGIQVLDIVAQNTAFDPTCLVAPAGGAFTINFDNKDPVTSVGQHNIAIYTDAAAASDPTSALFTGKPAAGPITLKYPVQALDAGDYFFHCDFHPQMTGTLAVITVKGGGGGGGGNTSGGGNNTGGG